MLLPLTVLITVQCRDEAPEIYITGNSTRSDVVRPIIEEKRYSNATLLNFSGGGTNVTAPIVNDLYESLENYTKGLFVCSAGNNGVSNDQTAFYPSNFSFFLPNVISVGAATIDMETDTIRRAALPDYGWTPTFPGSNYGLCVDLFAPGTKIYSTWNNFWYDYKSGTSMAAPFVAGVAALVKSLHSEMTGAQLKTVLKSTVDTRSELTNLCNTGGIINAYKAVNHKIVGSIDITFNGTGLYTTGGDAVGEILLGKFHFFENGTSAIAERGKWINPIPYYISDDSYLVCGPVPAGISTYIAESGLGYLRRGAYFYAPCYGPSWNGTNLNYASLPLHIDVYSSEAAIYYNGGQYYPGEGLASTDRRRIEVK